LDEYCNIGYMDGMADALNSIRGFNMSCQIVVQSLSQWQEKYPDKEWENQLGTFNLTLYMGCNDLTSAEYISKKCGKVTINVTNNQMPLMPLFAPVYSSTRPYSQTRSSTARDLMQPDEVLRLDIRKCIVIFQGHKPALLFKLAPEEIPDYHTLKSRRVIDYIPEWKQRELEAAESKAEEMSFAPSVPQERVSMTKQRTETRRDTERKPVRKSRAVKSRQERKPAYEPPELEYDVSTISVDALIGKENVPDREEPRTETDIPNSVESRTELETAVSETPVPEGTVPAADETEPIMEEEPLGMVECSADFVLGRGD
ncbi:MAG: TraM recognition domain-containing protein, partial [Oscillospiraceae bacterium]|nr:TraM recognition domain-containing protein [Oscillospiraceae bacterium]